MASITLVQKVPQKIATGKAVLLTAVTGLQYGFGTTTPTEWFSVEEGSNVYYISNEFGDVWLNYDLDVANAPESKVIKYRVEV